MLLRPRRAFRPFVRLDVFPNTVRLLPPRIIGRAETFEQLPLPDVRAAFAERPRKRTLVARSSNAAPAVPSEGIIERS